MPKKIDTPLCLPESFIQSNQEMLCAMLGGERPQTAQETRPQAARIGWNGTTEDYDRIGSTAIVPIEGMILQHVDWWWKCCGSAEIAKILAKLETESGVEQIVLRINSPGGVSFAGAEIAEAVKRLAAVKPVHAFVCGEGCSAAYWIACCANSITAAPLSIVGSIGCYVLAYDYSKMLQRAGIRAVMMKSGPNKGAGAPGVKITPEQQTRLQEIVDSVASEFFSVVSTSRGLSLDSVAQWGDGGCWTAEDGIKLNLVDRICDWPTFIAEFQAGGTTGPGSSFNHHGGHSMSITDDPKSGNTTSIPSESKNNESQAATVHELEKSFPRAGNDFIVAQLKQGATLDNARTAYIALLEEHIVALTAKASTDNEKEEDGKSSQKKSSKKSKSEDDDDDDDEKENEESSKKSSKTSGSLGNKPHAEQYNGSAGQTATEQWNAAVEAKISKGMNKAAAVRAVVEENPELQAAYIAEFNAKKTPSRNIG